MRQNRAGIGGGTSGHHYLSQCAARGGMVGLSLDCGHQNRARGVQIALGLRDARPHQRLLSRRGLGRALRKGEAGQLHMPHVQRHLDQQGKAAGSAGMWRTKIGRRARMFQCTPRQMGAHHELQNRSRLRLALWRIMLLGATAALIKCRMPHHICTLTPRVEGPTHRRAASPLRHAIR